MDPNKQNNQNQPPIPNGSSDQPQPDNTQPVQPVPELTQPVPGQTYPTQPDKTQPPVAPTTPQVQPAQPVAPTPPIQSNPVVYPGQAPQPQPSPGAVQPASLNNDQTINEIQNSMRSSILKIIIGLVIFSLVGVGLMFLLSSSPDETLNETKTATNTLAQYQVPVSWREESTVDAYEFFNGDSAENSSSRITTGIPTRIKFTGDPLTDTEYESALNKLQDDIESRSDGGMVLIIAKETTQVGGFDRVYDFTYQAQAPDNGTKISGKLRLLFDMQGYMHSIDVVGVQSYWNTNQEKLEEIVQSYELK